MRYFSLSKLKNSIESKIVILQDENQESRQDEEGEGEREQKCNKDMSSEIIKMIMKKTRDETRRVAWNIAEKRLLSRRRK